MRIKPDPVGAGQESVWSYPRPAIAEPTSRHLRIVHRGIVIAEARRGFRTLETSHPPSYYFPPGDVATEYLRPSRQRSLCEWKGQAVYFDAQIGYASMADVAWSYPEPDDTFAAFAGYLAFYARPFDECSVDGEIVTPQPGDFYGGWITSDLAGPFKGAPGTRFW